ncbi:MAG: glutathione synthase [SAR324 cluster bacterium]|uniref:Glutathione synthetase n=1 Tax=SAR324 cluster bacterium TaxID=2024889 RepID=A0A2A4TA58_9DELT|nr:MAG: glutathione synthase [SAR324 cluster bacterium]
MKSFKIAILMDPLETVHIDKDTTFALALEAQERGHEIWFVHINDLMMRDTAPCCYARKIQFKRADPCFEWLAPQEALPLDSFDYILVRKDPPFDERYFFATHFLSLCRSALVVNRPASLREAPEKIYSLNFSAVMPQTLITCHGDEIRQFMHDVGGEIIVKPLNRCGGAGVIYLHTADKNFNSLIEMSTNEGEEYIMAQRYLPEIRQGDKRVILINGKAEGAILRVPTGDEHRGNIHVGGSVIYSELTVRDQWLVDQIGPKLKEDGLYLVGLDIIGDYITEINVTSPTGIQEIKNLGGLDIAKIFWDRLPDFK